MNDRKLRAIGGLSLVSGTVLVILSLGFYLADTAATISIPILIVYSAIMFRFSGFLFNLIYRSRLIDLPGFLQKRYPPPGFEAGKQDCEILLLRTPSAVLSAPDCGEAIGIGYIASVLRENGFDVQVVDARLLGLDIMETIELILAYQPKALGINLNFQYLAPSTAELLRGLNERKYSGHITLGGLYASMAYEDIFDRMPSVDTIVRFEGEHTYLELVNSLDEPEFWSQIKGLSYRDPNGGIQSNPLRPLIPDLNIIPDPSRDFLPNAVGLGGYAYVATSRGCNGVCSYCVQQRSISEPVGRRWRGRDPEEVADEVQRLREDFDTRMISFIDDDFFGATSDGKTHAQLVAEALIERELDVGILLSVQPRDVDYDLYEILKQSGVDSLILAVDNFSQAVLDRYQKLTSVEQNLRSIEISKSLGLDVYLGIIMFDPWTSLEELSENFDILKETPFLRPWQILSKLEFYRGSPITVKADQEDLLTWNGYSASYDFLDPKINSVFKTIEEIMKILHPSMSELDMFRWGSLRYSESDEWILQHFSDEIAEINANYNRSAISLASEIVNRQSGVSALVAPDDLLDGLDEKAEDLNRNATWDINKLRQQALQHKKEHTIEMEELEIVEA